MRSWKRFEAQHASVAAAYDQLSNACSGAGPLDEKTIALVKLGISVGGSLNRTVHAHTRKAIEAGVPAGALRQVALIAMPTLGLPRALDALRWIEESIDEAAGQ
jgi:alkylhydroperoxidase/carboxymuconolactone decarboxylase family protein YurZ